MKPIAPTLIITLLLIGCDTTLTGYPFKVQAIYQAPLTNLNISINTYGRVPAGADVSEDHNAIVTFTPISPPGNKVTLSFINHSQIGYIIETGGPQRAAWGFRNREESLSKILERAEYPDHHTDEIAEVSKAINGAIAGPKAVIRDGQSTHLKVIKVDLSR